MKNILLTLTVTLAATLAITSCERPIMTDDTTTDPDANVILTITPYYQEPFTRTLAEQCTRLTVAIFNTNGEKVKNISQHSDSEPFGTVALSLPKGHYSIVAIAHNSQEGNTTITSTEKATFASNKVTDTFSRCDTMTVGDTPVKRQIELPRVVSMIRLTTANATIPDEVQRLKFYYTGGSSTLNPTTGYGCVNSKQTEYRDVRNTDGTTVTTYELYTFPHEQTDQLKMTITALTADDNEVAQWTMPDIPVTLNKITNWTGSLFSDSGIAATQQGSITLSIDTTWDGETEYTY